MNKMYTIASTDLRSPTKWRLKIAAGQPILVQWRAGNAHRVVQEAVILDRSEYDALVKRAKR